MKKVSGREITEGPTQDMDDEHTASLTCISWRLTCGWVRMTCERGGLAGGGAACGGPGGGQLARSSRGSRSPPLPRSLPPGGCCDVLPARLLGPRCSHHPGTAAHARVTSATYTRPLFPVGAHFRGAEIP